MAYFAIAFIAPNYRDYKNQWLKAYEPGTTTPKAMALDSAAATTVAKLQLNADGFLKSAGDALVIPYIEGAYDLWLFPTSAEADANDTSSAVRVADDINASGSGGELSQAYEFDSYQDMIANVGAVNLPDKKKISTGAGAWKLTTTVTPNVIANTSPQLYALALNGLWVEDFQAVENTDFSVAFRLAISVSGGKTIHIPDKRFIYDGVVITDPVVKIKGDRMPAIKTSFTGLENGTIIEGTVSFTTPNLHLVNFGVDLGTDTAAAAGDGLKCTTTLNAGSHLHIENLVGLGKNTSDGFHSLLFESYQKVTGGNIHGAYNLFSCVFKCKNINLGDVYCSKSQSDGLYLKSDTSFGKTQTANIGRLIVDGADIQGKALRIQSDNDQIETINIGQLILKNTSEGIKVDGNGVGVNELIIGSIILEKQSTRGIVIEANTGFVKTLIINNVIMKRILAKPIEFVGNIDFVQLSNVMINYDPTAASTSDSIVVGSGVGKTQFSNIMAFKDYDPATSGVIVYNNFGTDNQLVNTNCNLLGVGTPVDGVKSVTISGATNTVSIPDNKKEKTSLVKVSMAADSTVSALSNTRFSTTEFEIGHVCHLLNDSSFAMTVANTFGGKMFLTGGADVVVASNRMISLAYGGAVWHQV